MLDRFVSLSELWRKYICVKVEIEANLVELLGSVVSWVGLSAMFVSCLC